jgi:tripartite-type tricarboxylate transporter receptor subunit TctC
MSRIVAMLGALVVAASASATMTAKAQDYPNHTVRIIIPLGPGGGGDIFARALADELQKRLGQPFVVENRPGGGLNIGTRACAQSAPDGYTLCVISNEPIVYSQFLFKNLPFDPEKDFAPITNLFFNALLLATNPSLKVKTVPELIALAKTRKLSYSTFSFPLATFMEKLNKEHHIDIVRVPYRSGNEVVTAVLSGTTPIALLGLANMVPQVQSGLITGIALNAKARSPLVPNIPTMTEAIGEDYPQSWFGLFAPAGTPKAIINKINAEVTRITSAPAFIQKMYVDRAIEHAVDTPEAFARFIQKDRENARRIVKESGVQPE